MEVNTSAGGSTRRPSTAGRSESHAPSHSPIRSGSHWLARTAPPRHAAHSSHNGAMLRTGTEKRVREPLPLE
ncbi:hypothetical protein NJ7G_1645 [Natrinema sp. J7-2]|nr:hypothetical protein NJ7G_1645 [Natrinema sp. J7-2]